MRNLDKIWAFWSNLEKAYLSKSETMSRSEFLRFIVAYGDKDKVLAVLAKAANDVITADDSKKYAELQSMMLALLNRYDEIEFVGDSLNDFVIKLVGNAKIAVGIDDLVRMISVTRPCYLKPTKFEESMVGMELITAEQIHKIRLVSDTAVILPVWANRAEQLGLSGHALHQLVSRRISENLRGPAVFLQDTASDLINEGVIQCGCISVPVETL